MKFNEIVKLNSNQLFKGAVDLDWYLNNNLMSQEVATSYFFHGPKNHSGNNGLSSRKLTDTISMSEKIINDVSTPGSKMELAIAGYGAGKSHFSVMISNLLNSNKIVEKQILENIAFVDHQKASQIKQKLEADSRPVLIIPINGMRNCNLTEEFIRVTKLSLKKDNQSCKFLNKFDSKYESLSYIIANHKKPEFMLRIIQNCGCKTMKQFENRMDDWDEDLFNCIIHELEKNGERIPVSSSSNTEIKEIIPAIYQNTCGHGKYYKSMLIIFDEFGKYMMFAAEDETKAGKGIMQSLFEGINNLQKYSITLLGLSQLDLKEYQNTTVMYNENIENNKNRYITRFNDAKRYYLSVNFETLICNLIKVSDESFIPRMNTIKLSSKKSFLNKVFPSSQNYSIWADADDFSKYFYACWPLDSFALWILVYLSSVNNILQQRSALNVLKDCFSNLENKELKNSYLISAVDLFDAGLGIEFKNSENSFQNKLQIANDYYGVLEKYNDRLTKKDIKVLQAIVISTKISAVTNNFEESRRLISFLTFIKETEVELIINDLTEKYNMIQEGLTNLYEINSDVPSQIEYRKILKVRLSNINKHLVAKDNLRYIKDFLDSYYFENDRSNLFCFLETPFGMNNDVKTLEWRFNPDLLVSLNVKKDLQDYINQIKWNDLPLTLSPKGTILYMIINENEDIESLKIDIKKMIIDKGNSIGHTLPLMVVLLPDYDKKILKSSIIYDVVSSFSTEEKSKFGPYLQKDKTKCKTNIVETIDIANTKNIVISGLEEQPRRRVQIATNIFENIYSKIIPFPMDGFQNGQNRGVNEIITLLNVMLYKTSKEYISSKLTTTQRKHCFHLVDTKWGFFDYNGNLKEFSDINVINEVFEFFDSIIEKDNKINSFLIFKKMSEPPFGINAIGALLLTFIYLLSREKKLRCVKNGDIYDIGTLTIPKNFIKQSSKNFSISDLNNLSFVKMKSDDQLWIDLLDRWENAILFSELIECYKENDNLLNTLNIQLPNRLNAKQFNCKVKSDNAIKKVYEYNDLVNKYKPYIEKQASQGQVYYLYKNLAKFKSKVDLLMDNKEEWNITQVEEIDDFFDYYLNDYLPNTFYSWFSQTSLMTSNKKLHDANRQKYENLIEVFNELNLYSYSQKLDCEIKKDDLYIKNNIEYDNLISEYRNRMSLIKREINSLHKLSICKNYDEILTEQLNILEEFPKDNLKIISKNLDDEISEVKKLKEKVENVIIENRNNLSSIYDYNLIKNVNELDSILEKARNLHLFFLGTPDAEDVAALIEEINTLKVSCDSISKAGESEVRLKSVFLENLTMLKENFEDNLLDYETILKNFYFDCLDKLRFRSNNFVDNVQQKSLHAKGFSQWLEVTKMIENKPLYITTKDLLILKDIDRDVKDKLNKEKILYIVSLIKDLDESGKNKLFDMIQLDIAN